MDSEALKALAERYGAVRERLSRAVAAAGRKAEEVTLVAVSKLHPAEAVAAVAALGQKDFGENYVQEAAEKREELDATLDLQTAASLRWHMIGHVQSRKAPMVAGAYHLVHTIDSVKLADAMEKRCAQAGAVQSCLIEVNVGDEAQKSGTGRDELFRLADHIIAECPGLRRQCLMCIPPVYDAGEAARPYFAQLRELKEELEPRLGMALPTLSMGMSGDFEWAVLEGATYVRVGTDIFGSRPPKV